MNNLEKRINEAIENKKEFDFLNNFNLICTNKPLNESYLNFCLDIYNKLINEQMKYFAKYNALRLTCLQLTHENKIQIK